MGGDSAVVNDGLWDMSCWSYPPEAQVQKRRANPQFLGAKMWETSVTVPTKGYLPTSLLNFGGKKATFRNQMNSPNGPVEFQHFGSHFLHLTPSKNADSVGFPWFGRQSFGAWHRQILPDPGSHTWSCNCPNLAPSRASPFCSKYSRTAKDGSEKLWNS